MAAPIVNLPDRALRKLRQIGSEEPETLGRYRILREIGRGGMGVVFEAEDPALRRRVALKVLREDAPDLIARFLREAQTIAKLSHPNIAGVHEIGEDGGRRFIAMQFVDGPTVAAEPVRDPREAARIVRDAALAVHHAHKQGIVHRDLKPGNLMLDRDRRVFVLDFGLAKPIGAGSMTTQGVVMGTLAYMPPEQALGRTAELDARSDVYSLGATLHELLSGRPPFLASGEYDLLRAVVEEEPAPLPAGTDRGLATIVEKCLEKTPSRRYSTAWELGEDLTRYLEGEPVRAHPPSMTYRLGRFLRKRRAVVAAAAMGFSGVVLSTAIFLPRWLDARRRAAAADARTEEVRLYGPLEPELESLKLRLYQPDFRFTDAEFARYESIIRRIRDQMSRTGESALGWYLIARCHEILADVRGVDEACGRALVRDPDHAPVLLLWGRLRLEHALGRWMGCGAQEPLRARALREAREAEAMIRRGAQLAGSERSFELDLAIAYLTALEHWGRRPYSAAEMLERWRDRPFKEEFLLIEAVSQGSLSPREMEETAGRVLARVPSHYKAHFWRGTGKISNARWKEAVVDFATAIAIQPRWAEPYLSRGACRQNLGGWKDALEDYTRAAELDPNPARAFLNRGTVHRELGDSRAAMQDFDRAAAADPALPSVFLHRGSLREALEDPKAAEADYVRALDLDPHYALARAYLGRVFLARGDLDRAMAEFDRALRDNPYCGVANAHRARILFLRGDWAGAEAEADRAIALVPECDEAYTIRGWIRKNRGNLRGALADWDHALSRNPRDTTALWGRASIRAEAGDLKGALSDYDRAIVARPNWAETYVNRAGVLVRLRRFAEAEADYEAAVRINPGLAPAYVGRGNLRLWTARYPEAIAEYTRASKLDPRVPDAYFNRGLAHTHLRNFDAAWQDFTLALAVQPWEAKAWYNRGLSRLVHRIPPAFPHADLSMALQANPAYAEALLNRSRIRAHEGERTGAIEDLRRALSVAPAHWRFRPIADLDLARLLRQ